MLSPKLPSFFKTIRPKGFEYKPRYYDKQKETINKYKDRIKSKPSKEPSAEDVKSRIQSEFRSFKSSTGSYSTQRKRTIRLILLLTIVAAFIFYLFFKFN